MDDRIEYRPTLLVGVGGTGGQIIERVYRRALATGLAERGRIATLCFDTDVNDISQRRGLEDRSIVQTSSLKTVHDILRDNPQAEAGFSLARSELPDKILNMRLIDGAGQIRMLSQLALYDRLTNQRESFNAIVGNIISGVARHDSRSVFEGALQVIITGSLAGATGSGMFLQTSLLLRRIAQAVGIQAIEPYGLFLMPDVFVRGANIQAQQIDNVLVNGYAALRELSAVINRAEGHPSARQFQFEFAPGLFQNELEAPFKAVTLIDYENVKGGNLGPSLDHYIELATRAVFLQTFTTVGKKTLSGMVNDALAANAAAARGVSNSFAGIGVAAVVYPVEAIAAYLSQRFAQEVLTGDWLRLDRLYRDAVRRYEELRAAGNLAARPPDIGATFLENLDQFALTDKIAFFAEIREGLMPTLVDPETREARVEPQHEAYLDAFLTHMVESFWQREDLETIRRRARLDPTAFRNKGKIETIVRQCESILDLDFQAIETALLQRPDQQFQNTITYADDLSIAELKPYHLQSYVVAKGPHPVQVRAFLYSVLREIRQRRSAIDVAALRRAVLNEAQSFSRDEAQRPPQDQRSNPAVFESARQAANPGLMGRVWGSSRSFGEDYARYYDESLAKMRRYAEGATKAKILDLLVAEVEALSTVYEGLFAEVGRVVGGIEENVRKEEVRHQSGPNAFDGNVYIHADPASKQAAWEELKLRTVGARQTAAVNETLDAALYKKFRADRKARRATAFDDLHRLFEKAVIEDFALAEVRRNHGSVWDISVFEAARREADRLGIDWKERLRRAVDVAKGQAEPFLRLEDASNGQAMIHWAMNPSLKQDYGNADEFERLFKFDQGESALLADDFTHYELLCVNSRLNLELSHLAKLASGDGAGSETLKGRYYKAYSDRLERLIRDEIEIRKIGSRQQRTSVLTPHIHKAWHRGSVLPEVSLETQRRIDLDAGRAAVAALGLRLVQKEIEFGRAVTYFSTVGRPSVDTMRIAIAETDDVWQQYLALQEKAELKRMALDVWGSELATLSPAAKFAAHPIALQIGGADITQRILDLAAPRDKAFEAREQAAQGLFTAQRVLLGELAAVLLPHLESIGRDQIVDAFLGESEQEAFGAFSAREGIVKSTVDRLRAVREAGLRQARSARA